MKKYLVTNKNGNNVSKFMGHNRAIVLKHTCICTYIYIRSNACLHHKANPWIQRAKHPDVHPGSAESSHHENHNTEQFILKWSRSCIFLSSLQHFFFGQMCKTNLFQVIFLKILSLDVRIFCWLNFNSQETVCCLLQAGNRPLENAEP